MREIKSWEQFPRKKPSKHWSELVRDGTTPFPLQVINELLAAFFIGGYNIRARWRLFGPRVKGLAT